MQHQVGTAVRARCTERTARLAAVARCYRRLVVVAVAPATIAASACSSDDDRAVVRQSERASATAGVPAGGGGSSASVIGATPTCPATGQWQLCSVVERLERAGLAPRQDSGRVTEAPLSSPGVAIQLGRSELRIFVYADRAARERDQAKLDTSRYVGASEPLSMHAEPTLIVSENLLAILRSRSDHQRERVSDVLTAGPPQKPGTKG